MAVTPIMDAVYQMSNLLGYVKDDEVKVSLGASGANSHYIWTPKINIRAQNKLHDCGWNIVEMTPEGTAIRVWVQRQ